jgi:Uncharacterized protein conserved in bacteria
MKNILDEKQLFTQLLNMLAAHMGNSVEIVLHDLTNDYEHTIVDIRNGELTGRSIGGCGSNLGLEVLKGTVVDGDRYNYVTQLPEGRILRTSSLYIRDESGKSIGSICINTDITDTIKLEEYLHNYNHYIVSEEDTEILSNDIGQILDHIMNCAQLHVGKAPDKMSKQEKLEYLKYLDKKGVFLITKAGKKVCETLKISKGTLYTYLDEARML